MSHTPPEEANSQRYPALEELRQILAREQTPKEFRKRYGYDPSEPSRWTRAREARRKAAKEP